MWPELASCLFQMFNSIEPPILLKVNEKVHWVPFKVWFPNYDHNLASVVFTYCLVNSDYILTWAFFMCIVIEVC